MRVALCCGENFMPWGPGSLDSGIGGSEEAAIHMSRELALLGCEVTVYGNPPPQSPDLDHGVRWRSWRTLEQEPAGDVFIAWRHAEYVARAGGFRQVYHWTHNRQDVDYPRDLAARIDRILVVSRHHAADAGFSGIDPRRIHVTSNGLDPESLRAPGGNEPHRAIYASCPARGLLHVLRMWPAIKRAVPHARLDVYHGFTPVYDAMAQLYPGLNEIRRDVLRLLDDIEKREGGVCFHGMVGHHRLAEGFAGAGVWVYPTETPETSCITAMKALAMGCLPVTSGYAVLGETLGGRDFGPVHAVKPIGTSRWRLSTFRRRVIWAMKNGGSRALMAKRLEFARWARQRYSWKAVARDWMDLFHRVGQAKSEASPRAHASAM